jgi:general secretion pathway protein K
VALITVLVVVAIATVLGVGMLRNQQQALQHAAGLFQQDQARLYTQGAEDFVRDLLGEDLKSDKRRNKQIDHPGETWAKPFPPFPVEGGMVRARVEDLQGRFNVNRLAAEGPDGPATAIFRQLLRNLGLPDTLAPAVADWLDADDQPRDSDGAEDDFYSRLPRPYRAGNQPLADISELRLVRGFTPEIIAKLEPFICALPEAAALNVNTASPTVLSALLESLTATAAAEIERQRPEQGYASVDDFLGQTVFNGLDSGQKERLRQQLDVRSRYFLLMADAEIGGRHSMAYSVLARSDSGTLAVISRDLGRKVAQAAGKSTSSAAPETGGPQQDQESPR